MEGSDDEDFSEVLALLDEYNTVIDDSSCLHDRSKRDSSFSTLLESSAWTAFEAAHPITKTISKHRNGAREMRRREVKFLRTCVKGLDLQLAALKTVAEQRARVSQSTNHTRSSQTCARMNVWKELAARQLDQRLASERENTRLRSLWEDQYKVQEMLQRALNTRVARRMTETSLVQEKRTRKVYGLPLESSSWEEFHELEMGVDFVFHEAARVFFQADTGTGVRVGVFGDKTLPFEPDLTAEAAWRCLAHAFQHEKHRFSYVRERRRKDVGDVTRDDTVCERFQVGIQTPDQMAEFRIRQVFRRYCEADQTVIAWKSFIDPAVFQGKTLAGFRFQEKGSCVIRRDTKISAGTCSNDFTLLRIWHVITPETLAHSTEFSPQYIEKLTEFVLGGSSSVNTVQMIENMLIGQEACSL